jgi:hypothetical protein
MKLIYLVSAFIVILALTAGAVEAKEGFSWSFFNGTIILSPSILSGTKISCNDITDNVSSVCNATGGGGSGTVTSVASGNGLTGGPITTTGTLSIDATTCTTGNYTYWDGTQFLCAPDSGAAGNGTGTVTSLTQGDGINLTPDTITSTGSIGIANLEACNSGTQFSVYNGSHWTCKFGNADSDTTYDNSTGLTLTGTTFSVNAASYTNWNLAFGWGDHGVAGYLTSEVDGSTTNELQDLWDVFSADSGSTTANSNTDTLTVSGAGTVSTSIAADTLTITGSAHTVDTDTTYTNGTGLNLTGTTFSILDSLYANWNTAFGWGDHGVAGYSTGAHTTNTNADTICAGSTTYLDGDGGCDDISSVYEPAGITESDISDLTHTTNTNAATICTGTGNYLDGEGNCDPLVTNTDTQLTEAQVEAMIFDNDNTDHLNMSGYNVTSVDCIVFQSGGQICTS